MRAFPPGQLPRVRGARMIGCGIHPPSQRHGLGPGDNAMPRSTQGTVIIVEDDPSMCQALERILRLGGFRPLLYGSAEALLDEGVPDDVACLILDLQLPGMDGFALHERLTVAGTMPPVIFITAFDEPDARSHAARVGAVFLAKPFAGRALLEALRRCIERFSGASGSYAGA
jgi:FixJ family two-component response regulator